MPSNQRSNPHAVSDRRLYTQLRNLRTVFDRSICAVLAENRALDRFLSSYWRSNRCFGSRDRRLFSESIFAFFRFYGFLLPLLDEAERQMIESGDSRALSGRSAALLLTGAWVLENLPPEDAHKLLCREFDLPMIPDPVKSPACESNFRIKRFADYIAMAEPSRQIDCDFKQLQADWSHKYLQEMSDLSAYYAALAERPPLWLRVQNSDVDQVVKELAAAGLATVRHSRLRNALAVTSGNVNLYTLDAYKAGRVEVQDLASQVIAAACAPNSGERWWDCCAGAGGKTLALAEIMQRTGKVIAGDIREYKLEDLKRRARRSGFPNIETRPWDGKKVPPRKGASFDGILIDAPCSCSGVWRRNPDGRWNCTAGEVDSITQIQRNVLENVLPALRPGGVLVYATCSVFEPENSAMVKDFLARHPEFELENFANPLTGDMTDGMLKITGAAENCDSMFVARLRHRT